MLRATTAIAAALFALSAAAQAETVKEKWNQALDEDNPGRVTSAGKCLQDNSSGFACWNDHEVEDTGDASTAAQTSEVEPEPEPEPE